MSNIIRPDKLFYKKCFWILWTITGSIFFPIICLFILNLFINSWELRNVVIILFLSVAGSLVLMWLISIPIIKLWIKNLEFIIKDDRITLHKGILTKTQQNIPYRSVTDFALKRTLYDRWLGIGSINIQTAGQSHNPSGYEGSMVGLVDYETLHSDLKEKLKVLHPISQSVTTSESLKQSDDNVLNQILDELKTIRKHIEK